jgi:Fe-S-cluster containining protein
MTPLEIDIKIISRVSKIKENENFRFRSFLKGQDGEKVDRIAHRLNAEVESLIDCTSCGNCCENLRPCVNDLEIDALAKIDHVLRKYFIENFTEKDDFENIRYLKNIPCKYLNKKKCSVYVDRPEDCRSYPHIQKGSFNSRTLRIIGNYGICPIVFNVWERLKTEFKFR